MCFAVEVNENLTFP